MCDGAERGPTESVFRIERPGSYYLTRNLAGVAGKHGIEIAASDVTLERIRMG